MDKLQVKKYQHKHYKIIIPLIHYSKIDPILLRSEEVSRKISLKKSKNPTLILKIVNYKKLKITTLSD